MENRRFRDCAFCGCALLGEAPRVRCEDCRDLHEVCHGCAQTLVTDGASEGYSLAA